MNRCRRTKSLLRRSPIPLRLIFSCRNIYNIERDRRGPAEVEVATITRPREWESRAIPDVLLSGDHAKIAAWRRAEAERITRERRPDLTEC
jgi:tRNA G37 N-methylase TrmD